jgi:hypothetical protein
MPQLLNTVDSGTQYEVKLPRVCCHFVDENPARGTPRE